MKNMFRIGAFTAFNILAAATAPAHASEAPAVGAAAPLFQATTTTGAAFSLDSRKGQWTVLYFYPKDDTPGCTKQACDFRDSLDALAAAGITVLGLSPDKPEKLARFREHDALTFPLLSDPSRDVLTAYGAYGEKQNYGRTYVGVIRSTFVIDAKGKIEHALYNVKATGHVARVRKLLGV